MSEHTLRRSLDEEAAYWFLRLRDPGVSAEEIEAALDWQEQRPEHRAALARIDALWRLSDGLGRPPLPDPFADGQHRSDAPALRDALPAARHRFPRASRTLPLLAAGVAVVAVALTLLLSQRMPAFQEPELVRYVTSIGENRVVRLADNSEVTLSGASAIAVDYSSKKRNITLTDGEAFFKVAKDPARPFVVAAASGQVMAIGTQFDVRRGLEGVTVTVVEGTVQVQPLATQRNPRPLVAARLGAGHQVSYSSGGDIGAIVRVTPEQSLAWREGKLIFINRSLADIAVDLNRYSPKLIAIEGEAVRSFRFTGVIVVADMEDWLRALERSLPVKVIEQDHRLLLTATQPAAR